MSANLMEMPEAARAMFAEQIANFRQMARSEFAPPGLASALLAYAEQIEAFLAGTLTLAELEAAGEEFVRLQVEQLRQTSALLQADVPPVMH